MKILNLCKLCGKPKSVSNDGEISEQHSALCVRFRKLEARMNSLPARELDRGLDPIGAANHIVIDHITGRPMYPADPKDLALRDAIAAAIRSAVLNEREACTELCDRHTKAPGVCGCADRIRAREAP